MAKLGPFINALFGGWRPLYRSAKVLSNEFPGYRFEAGKLRVECPESKGAGIERRKMNKEFAKKNLAQVTAPHRPVLERQGGASVFCTVTKGFTFANTMITDANGLLVPTECVLFRENWESVELLGHVNAQFDYEHRHLNAERNGALIICAARWQLYLKRASAANAKYARKLKRDVPILKKDLPASLLREEPRTAQSNIPRRVIQDTIAPGKVR